MTLQELEALETKIVTQIEAILSKPDYKAGEHSYKWSSHLSNLDRLLRWVREEISNYPVEVTTIWRDEL